MDIILTQTILVILKNQTPVLQILPSCHLTGSENHHPVSYLSITITKFNLQTQAPQCFHSFHLLTSETVYKNRK